MHEDEQFEVVAEGEYPFTMMPHWVALSPMSDGAFRLYNFLLMHLNMGSGTRKAWPSKASLAALMGFTKEDSLDRHLNQLYAMGAVTVQRHRNESNMKKRNTYTLRLTPPHGFQGHTILSDWYETRKQETAGQTVPPKKGVRTPEKGGSVPPKKGVKQEPLPQQQPLKEDDQLPSSVDHQDDSQTSLFDDSFEEPTPSGAVAKRKGSNSVGKELARHRGDIEHLCEHLADGIEKLGLKRPKISKAWREEARLLLDSDEVPLETALGGISWALADSFWKSKILSMAKYRKHYPQIYITAKEQKEKKPQRQGRKSTDEKIAEHLSLVERMAKLDAMGMAAV